MRNNIKKLVYLLLCAVIFMAGFTAYSDGDENLSFAGYTFYDVEYSPELGIFTALAYTTSGEAIFTSPDGLDWALRASYPQDAAGVRLQRHGKALVWHPDLSFNSVVGAFIAIRDDGSKNRIVISTDGINWDTNSGWIGVGNITSIYQSDSQLTLCGMRTATGASIFDLYVSNVKWLNLIGSHSDGGGLAGSVTPKGPSDSIWQSQFPFMISNGANSFLMLSTEKGSLSTDGGLTWTPDQTASAGGYNINCTDAAYSALNNSFVLAHDYSWEPNTKFSTLPDNAANISAISKKSWSSGYTGATKALSIGGGFLVAGTTTGGIYRFNENEITLSSPSYTKISGDYAGSVNAIAYGNGKFVAAGADMILTFTTSESEYTEVTKCGGAQAPSQPETSIASYNFYDVEYSPELDLYVASAAPASYSSSSDGDFVFISSDGLSWRRVILPEGTRIQRHARALVWNASMEKFIALTVSDKSKCLVSENGINWSLEDIGIDNVVSIDFKGSQTVLCQMPNINGSTSFNFYLSTGLGFPLITGAAVGSVTPKMSGGLPANMYASQNPFMISNGADSVVFLSDERGSMSTSGGQSWNPNAGVNSEFGAGDYNAFSADATYNSDANGFFILAHKNTYSPDSSLSVQQKRKMILVPQGSGDITTEATIVLLDYTGYTSALCLGGQSVISGTETGGIYRYNRGHVLPSSQQEKVISPAYTQLSGSYTGVVRAITYGSEFVAAGDGALLCFSEADASYTKITEYTYDDSAFVGRPTVKNAGGESPQSFTSGETLYISSDVDNTTVNPLNARMMTAFYTIDDRLIDVKISAPLSISSGKHGQFQMTAVVPEATPAYLKVFIWDDFNSMTPLYSDILKFENNLTLSAAYKSSFPIGAAVVSSRLDHPREGEILKNHFSSVTAEFEMKWDQLQPGKEVFNFAPADQIIAFAEANDMTVRGHTFVWHSGNPDWLFNTSGAGGGAPTRTELLELLDDHIRTVMTRYQGKIACWDVVNEALSDEFGQIYRVQDNNWLSIIGPDYVKEVFKIARKAANDIDPGVKLYYNDYNLEFPDKLQKAVDLVNALNNEEILVDGIGLQSHLCTQNPGLGGIERAITTFSEMGLQVQITELDISVYTDRSPSLPYTSKMAADHADWYAQIFKLLYQNRNAISGVTLWGISDPNSWLNQEVSLPDAPLLFDADYNPKSAFYKVLEIAR